LYKKFGYILGPKIAKNRAKIAKKLDIFYKMFWWNEK